MIATLIVRVHKLTKAGLLKWGSSPSGFKCQCGDTTLELRNVSLPAAKMYELWDGNCRTPFRPDTKEAKEALGSLVAQIEEAQAAAAASQVESAAEHWLRRLQAPEFQSVE